MNQLKLISKYRSQLMGLAILQVIVYHVDLHRYLQDFHLFHFLADLGYGGVDVFIFLSGFGLYYSSLKKESIGRFYSNRFIRILPPYIIIILISHIVTANYSISDYLMEVSTVGFWTYQNLFDWYVPTIILFYLFFPFYIKLFNKYPVVTTCITMVIGIFLTLVINQYVFVLMDLRKLVMPRIPIFALGILFGKLSLDNTVNRYINNKWLFYIISILGFAILYIAYHYYRYYLWYGWSWLPFILIVPGGLLFTASIFEKYIRWKYVHQFLAFVGSISLEIYLFHLIPWRERDWFMETTGLDFITSSILVLIVGILGAYLVSLVTKRIVLRYNKQKNNKSIQSV